jgi:hypothetical protein
MKGISTIIKKSNIKLIYPTKSDKKFYTLSYWNQMDITV